MAGQDLATCRPHGNRETTVIRPRHDDPIVREQKSHREFIMMEKFLLATFLFGLLGMTIWWSVALWNSEGAVEMSGHGYIAMTLGVIFSLAVGVGLMRRMRASSARWR